MNSIIDGFANKHIDDVLKWTHTIEDMLGDYKSYHYAEETLVSILDSIEKFRKVTEGQKKAILNIKNNPAKYHERSPRRY